jgi:predicted nuclease of predicted toxin-antitoxin system
MKLLFDQNLSRKLPKLLSAEFPQSGHVLLVGLDKADDKEIWEYASTNDFALVSKDSDFQQLATKSGPPPKVIRLRIGNTPTKDIESLLRARKADIQAFLIDPSSPLLELP